MRMALSQDEPYIFFHLSRWVQMKDRPLVVMREYPISFPHTEEVRVLLPVLSIDVFRQSGKGWNSLNPCMFPQYVECWASKRIQACPCSHPHKVKKDTDYRLFSFPPLVISWLKSTIGTQRIKVRTIVYLTITLCQQIHCLISWYS